MRVALVRTAEELPHARGPANGKKPGAQLALIGALAYFNSGPAGVYAPDRIEPDALARVDLPKSVADRHRVVDGDVLLQSRGGRYPALVARGAVAGAVLVAPLFLLRPQVERIAADYLATILNAPATQARLSGSAVGTHVPQVPADAIRSLPIPLPNLDEQRAIAALDALFRREARLAAELADLRAAWLHAQAQDRDAA